MKRKRMVAALLAKHGRTYCDELGINIARNTPSVLFRWLCATILFSARIQRQCRHRRRDGAYQSRDGRRHAKWRLARWDERTHVLNAAGYARYDESTSTKLGEAARFFSIDMMAICAVYAKKPAAMHRKSIGSFRSSKELAPSVRISFCREIQAAWQELYPFADAIALDTARRLKLGDTARDLSLLVGRDDFRDWSRLWFAPILLAITTR